MVDVAEPFAVTGPVPTMIEFVGLAAGTKLTVPPLFTTGVAIASVLASARVDFRVQLD